MRYRKFGRKPSTCIQEMIEYLKSQPKRVTVYDEQLVRKLIEKITVYDDHLDFLFKSGIQIEMKG